MEVKQITDALQRNSLQIKGIMFSNYKLCQIHLISLNSGLQIIS